VIKSRRRRSHNIPYHLTCRHRYLDPGRLRPWALHVIATSYGVQLFAIPSVFPLLYFLPYLSFLYITTNQHNRHTRTPTPSLGPPNATCLKRRFINLAPLARIFAGCPQIATRCASSKGKLDPKLTGWTSQSQLQSHAELESKLTGFPSNKPWTS
jgi:hypothetical protein